MYRRLSLRAFARGLIAAVVLAGAAVPALADRLPASVLQAAPELRELGKGRLSWFGLHLYDARLWAKSDRFRMSEPFALALTYARGFRGEKIASASTDEIERLGFGSETDRARWDAEMRRLFPDVEPGHELVGLHLPGKGAQFFHDGRYLGEIADPEFARAFFSIWLDPRTRASDLRTALIGAKR